MVIYPTNLILRYRIFQAEVVSGSPIIMNPLRTVGLPPPSSITPDGEDQLEWIALKA